MGVIPRSVSLPAIAIGAPRLRPRAGPRFLACLRGAAFVALLLGARTVFADGGDGDRALPALGHVALAEHRPTGRITAAGTVGFGLTEAQGSGDGLHER